MRHIIKYLYSISSILLLTPLYLQEEQFNIKFDDVWLFRLDTEHLQFEEDVFLPKKIQDEIISLLFIT